MYTIHYPLSSYLHHYPLYLQVEVEGVETAWKLECFPNGKQKIGEDTAGAVSVFLYPANTSAINRQFSFAIGWVENMDEIIFNITTAL